MRKIALEFSIAPRDNSRFEYERAEEVLGLYTTGGAVYSGFNEERIHCLYELGFGFFFSFHIFFLFLSFFFQKCLSTLHTLNPGSALIWSCRCVKSFTHCFMFCHSA